MTDDLYASLKPVLLGYTVANLWGLVHPVALIGWGLLLLAPFWRGALTLAYLPPLFHAVLYATILLPKMIWPDDPNAPPPDLNDMFSIQALFRDPDIFFCGWIHYLAYDQLVGLAIAYDALQTVRTSKLTYYTVVTPCLFLTFYIGPVGYLCYVMVRHFLMMGSSADAMPRAKLD